MTVSKRFAARGASIFALAVVCWGSAANAQMAPDPVQSDLDGDGVPETFILAYPEPGRADLVILGVDRPTQVIEHFVWRGGMAGQEPYLELAPNGSVRVVSGNESIGRNRWGLTQTIAYRDGAYRVAGVTYHWRDTLDLSVGGICDLNLLNGRGIRTIDENRPDEPYRVTFRAPAVQDWNEDSLFDSTSDLPIICGPL